jgi:hypothetical protein
MKSECPVPMVRCHLDGGEDDPAREVRYIPAAEFELWRHFMETRHFRVITVDEVSVWVPETPAAWDAHEDADALLPVLRLQLLAHFDPRCRWSVSATPGYFVPAASTRSAPETTEAVA